MDFKKRKSENLETYFRSFSVMRSIEASLQGQQQLSQEASSQDQSLGNSQFSQQISSQYEVETTALLSQDANFEAVTIKDVKERSTDIVCDLGTIDGFPSRPILKNFPDTNGRKFVSKWYSEFSWLEYSIMLDRVFCFACRHFNSGHIYARDVFSIIGFSQWKHALEKGKGLKKHDSSVDHMIAMVRIPANTVK